MDEKRDYLVTEKAKTFVAGRRSPGAGKTMQLTPAEAEHDLILGNLSEPDPKPARKPRADPATPADA